MKSWLKFVSVRAVVSDTYVATFEVDGVPVEHEVEVMEWHGIHSCSGTSYFAMMERGWDSFEQKKLIFAEVSKMMQAALDLPRVQ